MLHAKVQIQTSNCFETHIAAWWIGRPRFTYAFSCFFELRDLIWGFVVQVAIDEPEVGGSSRE